jgi:uncharacterized protein (DUF1697 family)
VPLREAFEQVAPKAELSAKLARTIIRAMPNVLEIMVLSSSLFFACVRQSGADLVTARWEKEKQSVGAAELREVYAESGYCQCKSGHGDASKSASSTEITS